MSRELRFRAIKLIERKLTGAKRQEALRWVRGVSHTEKLQPFVDRLETMPDTGAEHSERKLGPEAIARIRQEYIDGWKIGDIAARHGVSTGLVISHTRDLPRRVTHMTEEEIADIRESWARGERMEEIAARLGRSVPACYKHVREVWR